MRYTIVESKDIDNKLVSSTLVDYLGHAGLWHTMDVRVLPLAEESDWGQYIIDTFKVPSVSSLEDLGAEDVVLGPTDEQLVEIVTGQGASYLAMDDGLVELSIETEGTEEVPVVPDTDKEIPAVPKRNRRKPKEETPPVEETPSVEEPVVEEWTDEQRAALTEAYDKGYQDAMAETSMVRLKDEASISGHLRAIIMAIVSDADEEYLFDIVYGLRPYSKGEETQ